jgi:hypothetical protein
MVRAIIDGSKTQTRRVLNVPHESPLGKWEVLPWGGPNGGRTRDGQTIPFQNVIGHTRTGEIIGCPYGQPGDRLWVRESGWERPERTPKMLRDGADTWAPYYFDADGIDSTEAADLKVWGFKRRPGIHMPRFASRITLEITGVRVERLQDIGRDDAMAEGIVIQPDGGFGLADTTHYHFVDPRVSYWSLWEAINGPGSVEANPWVWVVEFKRMKGGAP